VVFRAATDPADRSRRLTSVRIDTNVLLNDSSLRTAAARLPPASGGWSIGATRDTLYPWIETSSSAS
jgi:hypothetical protein